MPLRSCLLFALLTLCASAHALTIEHMRVSRDHARYTVDALMTLNVGQSIAYRAATDYERLPEFNPSIVRSERIGDHRLRSQLHLCVAFFCKDIRQVMRYTEQAPDTIDMRVVPGAGDLKSGSAHWRFDGDTQGTRLQFTADIEPGFWVPPLIGPYLIARELRAQARVTGAAIERLADDYAGTEGPHA